MLFRGGASKQNHERVVVALRRLLLWLCVCLVAIRADEEGPLCETETCVPNCVCPDAETSYKGCAIDYGAWGWELPDDAGPATYEAMPPRYNISETKLKPAGMRGANRVTGIGTGIGTMQTINNETMAGTVYFEVNPNTLSKSSYLLIAELYGGIDFGLSDCDVDGIILGKQLVNMTGVDDKVLNFDYQIVSNYDYNALMEDNEDGVECHPRSKNGQMARLEFSLKDPWYYNEQSASIMNIWYPKKIGGDEGNLEFCVRLNLVESSTVLSFLDTKFKIDILAPDAETNWVRYNSSLEQVKTYSNQPIGIEEDDEAIPIPSFNSTDSNGLGVVIVPQLEVDGFLCSHPHESDDEGKYPARTFKNGQTFRICVSPSRGNEDKYAIVDFREVLCANKGREVVFVEEGNINDELTRIDSDTMGYARARGGFVEDEGTISLDAIMTSELAGLFSKADTFFQCEGTVSIKRFNTEGGDENNETDTPEPEFDALGQFKVRIDLVNNGGGLKGKKNKFFSWFSSSGSTVLGYRSAWGTSIVVGGVLLVGLL